MKHALFDTHKPNNHCGFTLLKTIIVISIILLIVALLLPALSAATEASRNAACINDLRQLGLGYFAYASDFKGYPASCSDPQWDTTRAATI